MDFINENLLTTALSNQDYSTVYESEVLERYHSIRNNHYYSLQQLEKIKAELVATYGDYDENTCSVVAFGSFARLDAGVPSDLDHLVVVSQDFDTQSLEDAILQALGELNIPTPNPDGVFVGRANVSQVVSEVGSHNDDYKSMTRRLLFLLESRVIIGPKLHHETLNRLIEFYGQDTQNDPRKNFVFLLNDLIRYFRTICVNYVHSKEQDSEKWPIRNIKLRHSRVIMFASLVAMLGVLSTYRESDINTRLSEFIELTPLQRLHRAYLECGDTGFYKVAGSYDVFLSFMNKEETRESLKNLDYAKRYETPDFSTLKANSDALASELTRFILDRRGEWSDRFFEYLFI